MRSVTLDHKSGFDNVPLHPDSWIYLGSSWQRMYDVWTVLRFCWYSSLFIYHFFSNAVTQYIRYLGVPIITLAPSEFPALSHGGVGIGYI